MNIVRNLSPKKIRLFILSFTLLIMLATIIVGYQAYVSSRDTVLNTVYQSNLDLARALRDFSATDKRGNSETAVLSDLQTVWNNMDRSNKGDFLCVIDKKGILTLHTSAKDREGVDVGQSPIHPTNLKTLLELIAEKNDYVGPYLSSSGQDQIAAFAYAEGMDSVISIHVPYDQIEEQIFDTTLPWIISLMVIGGLLLPLSNLLLHRLYALSNLKVKASENHLRTLVQTLPDLVWLKNAEGAYLSCNPKFERLFGSKEAEIAGKTDYDFVDKELADFSQKNDKQAMAAGKSTINEEELTFADDGHKELTETVKTPMYAPDGTLIGVLGVGRDITERRQTEEQIRRSQKMDALGKLTGGIAHDYNNMLGVILGYSELIEEITHDQPELTEYINVIRHAGERGAKLTKKLLTFSRQQSSENKIINLNTLLEGLQLMLEKTLTVRIRLVYELEKNIWSINLDESDLEDSILNMSINAMHAIEGNGQVTFETRNEAIKEIDAQHLQIPAGDYVLLSITDTGCGMDNKTKENIFDPFFSTKGELGTGLGLSQVYGLVHRSKGNIKIYSELGHGSRFTLYFPRCYESELEEKQLEEGEQTNLSGDQIILVVDDEPALAKLTSRILTQQGYHVFIANSGKEALLILEKEQVNVLLTDVIMPEMDGYQLAAIVHDKYPNTKIQLASGFSDDRHVDNVNASLQEELLHKPYHSKKLLLRIRELLNGSAD